MIKRKLTIFTLLSFSAIFISCNSSTSVNVIEDKLIKVVEKTKIDSENTEDLDSGVYKQADLRVLEFIKKLESEASLSLFFNLSCKNAG